MAKANIAIFIQGTIESETALKLVATLHAGTLGRSTSFMSIKGLRASEVSAKMSGFKNLKKLKNLPAAVITTITLKDT